MKRPSLGERWRLPPLSARMLWVLCLLAAAVKIGLCSFQLMYASPDLSPIDDTLMVNLAQSISSGNWLGAYDYLTLSKHAGFALWLAFLNLLHLNVLVGGQLLFAGACFVLLAALKPAFKTNWARLWVFGIVLFTPASWAESSLRIYRDNIYPALVLYVLAGFAGAFLRRQAPVRKQLGFYAAAGLGMGMAWLTHEDNLLLAPFIGCAAVAYLLFVWLANQEPARKKLFRVAALALPFVLWAGCLAGWSGMNEQYYGRFVVSDFTSAEFEDAMGAMSRACPEDQTRYNMIPYTTRLRLYEVSPTLATIEPYLETEEMYNGYGVGDATVPEFNSGGVHWAIRKAVWLAGYYETAQTSRDFYTAVAREINQACDEGLLPARGKQSGIFAPFKWEYLSPTVGKFFDEVKVFALFEQTRPTALLSTATAEQSAQWEGYLHCESTKTAVADTNTAAFKTVNMVAYHLLNACTWVQRILLWPMLAAALVWLCGAVGKGISGLRRKAPPQDLLANILVLGIGLTGLLRMAAIAYLMAVTLSFDIYLMYLNAACAPLLCFFAYGAAKWAENRWVPEGAFLQV